MKHGHYRKRKGSPTYYSWQNMKQRCNNPNNPAYRNYGGRDIKVCERWHDFRNFLEDMGERPESMSLDRYPDNDGNYELGNCRWATLKEQRVNTRPISRGPYRQRMFIAVNHEGITIVSNNQHEFARQHRLDQTNISKCLRGDYKQTKGWGFKWI